MSGARDRGDDAVGIDATNPVVPGIGYQHAAVGRDGYPRRLVQNRINRRSAITSESKNATARDRRNDSIRRHSPNATVLSVSNQDRSVGGHGNARRSVESRSRRGSSVTRESEAATACYGLNGAIEVNATNPAVFRVRNQDTAVGCDRDTSRVCQLRGCRRSTIARKTPRSRSCDSPDWWALRPGDPPLGAVTQEKGFAEHVVQVMRREGPVANRAVHLHAAQDDVVLLGQPDIRAAYTLRDWLTTCRAERAFHVRR